MAAPMEKTKYPGIYKRGSRYVITWYDRGKQHKEAHRTLTEAREAKGKRQAGERRAWSNVRFDDYAEQWLETYRGRKKGRPLSDTTRKLYRRSITKHAIPYFRGMRLRDIQAGDVEAFVKRMEGEGLGYSNMRGHLVALKVLLATAATRDKLIPANPAHGITLEASPPDERPKHMTVAELQVVLAALPPEWEPFFRFLAQTGVRISEAIGLRWEDVDLGTGSPHIKVRRQLYKGQTLPLKTRQSRRSLPLSPGMVQTLLGHRANRYGGQEAALWTTRHGHAIAAGNLRRRVLNPTVEPLGLDWVGFHSFRHTCASVLIDQGLNLAQVSRWLGHSNLTTTLNTYVHLMDDGLGDPGFWDTIGLPVAVAS